MADNHSKKRSLFFGNVFFVLLGMILAGCAGVQDRSPDQSMTSMDEMLCDFNAHQTPVEEYEGSLWQERAPLNELFMDTKARRVGDIVTISVEETSSATNNADTSTSRSSSLSMQLSNLLGLENSGQYPKGSGFDPFGSITGSTSNSFSGSGTTNRSGELDAKITARVMEVLQNGNLRILGKREIIINNEKQYIAVSGIIRPRDISVDNVILSTYIADAKIAYTGSGVINDKQNSGWFVRVLDKVWPF